MRHVLGEGADESAIERAVRGIFRNTLKNYYDLFRTATLEEKDIEAMVHTLHGSEHIGQAISAGKGVVLSSAHFGNWEAMMQLAASRFKSILIPVEPLKPDKLFQYICRIRARQGAQLVSVSRPLLSVFRALRQGGVVATAADRDITGSGIEIEFFGAPAILPDGHVQLALRTGAPLILAFGRRLPNDKFEIHIEPPLALERTGDLKRDVRINVEKVARVLERYISTYPEQWTMLQPVWKRQAIR